MDAPLSKHLKSPTPALIVGLLISLVIVLGHSVYTLYSVHQMRLLQEDVIDRNRKASRQLIRIQSDLNALGLAMRDILDDADGYPVIAWKSQFSRIRENLDDAIRMESELSTGRDSRQTAYLSNMFGQLWSASEKVFILSEQNEKQARSNVRTILQPQQEALSNLVARLLVSNHDDERKSSEQVNHIYARIEQNAWLFLGISVLVILGTGTAIILSNRSVFRQLEELSQQRSELARQLITTQESTFRAISRDLHDEFGQILTALGAMLRRAGREAPSPAFLEQIQELNEVVQNTLEKTRSLSQSLQPVIVEEQGLGEAILWHLSVFERQTGITVEYNGSHELPRLETARSVHIFRIVQEALNNIARHAQVTKAFVRVVAESSAFSLIVEDHGGGIPQGRKLGVGLVAMKERAELIGGSLTILDRNGGGTVVQLKVPLNEEVHNE